MGPQSPVPDRLLDSRSGRPRQDMFSAQHRITHVFEVVGIHLSEGDLRRCLPRPGRHQHVVVRSDIAVCSHESHIVVHSSPCNGGQKGMDLTLALASMTITPCANCPG